MASLATKPTFSCLHSLRLCPCPSSLRSTFSSSRYSSFTWPALWIEDWRLANVVIFTVASTWGPIFNVGKTIQGMSLIRSHLSSSRSPKRVSNCSCVWMLFINGPNTAVASWKTVRAGIVCVWGTAGVDDGSSFLGSRGFAETSSVCCEVGRSASGRRNWASRASTEGMFRKSRFLLLYHLIAYQYFEFQ